MKKFYSISIPEPCHENWNTMIPEEKGRFCNSCSKTVIDFTTMDTLEVQDFINHNKQNNICGHFKQTQLNSINLYIPSHVLIQKQGFNRMFLWTLLIVMGTSLMNCTNKSGNKQKIDSIEIVDSISSKTIKTFEASQKTKKNDSLKTKTCSTPVKDTEITEDGLLIIETLGEVEFIEAEATEIDSIIIPEKIEPVDLTGIPVYQEEEEEILVGLLTVETPPEFKNTPKHLKLKEKRDYFSEEITRIFLKNFNTSICTELTGKQKIFTQFKINKDGLISDIKIRAPHPDLEKETKRVLKLFPKFIPATQANQPVAIIYNLPIVFTRQD